MSDAPRPAAFMSYVVEDDKFLHGRITAFRERLENTMRFRGHADFQIFQDRRNIAWGERWAEAIDDSIQSADVLLVIATARWFQSSQCQAEYRAFTVHSDHVLPMLWDDKDALNLAHVDDGRVDDLLQFQHVEWPFTTAAEDQSAEAEKLCKELARRMSALLDSTQRTLDVAEPDQATPEGPANRLPIPVVVSKIIGLLLVVGLVIMGARVIGGKGDASSDSESTRSAGSAASTGAPQPPGQSSASTGTAGSGGLATDPSIVKNTREAVALVEAYVAALADGDLSALRTLEPDPTPPHPWDQAYLDAKYPDLRDSTASLVAASRVSDSAIDLLMGLVAREGGEQVERTSEFCAEFGVDVVEGTVDQLSGVELPEPSGDLTAESLQASLRDRCAEGSPLLADAESRFASDSISVVVPKGWAHRVESGADRWSDPETGALLSITPEDPALGTAAELTAEACTRRFSEVSTDEDEPSLETTLTDPMTTTLRDREPCVYEYRRSDGVAVVEYHAVVGQWVFLVRAQSGTNFLQAQRAASRAVQTLADLSPPIDCSAGCE